MRILATVTTVLFAVVLLPLQSTSANAAECVDERGCPNLIKFTQTGPRRA